MMVCGRPRPPLPRPPPPAFKDPSDLQEQQTVEKEGAQNEYREAVLAQVRVADDMCREASNVSSASEAGTLSAGQPDVTQAPQQCLAAEEVNIEAVLAEADNEDSLGRSSNALEQRNAGRLSEEMTTSSEDSVDNVHFEPPLEEEVAVRQFTASAKLGEDEELSGNQGTSVKLELMKQARRDATETAERDTLFESDAKQHHVRHQADEGERRTSRMKEQNASTNEDAGQKPQEVEHNLEHRISLDEVCRITEALRMYVYGGIASKTQGCDQRWMSGMPMSMSMMQGDQLSQRHHYMSKTGSNTTSGRARCRRALARRTRSSFGTLRSRWRNNSISGMKRPLSNQQERQLVGIQA